MAEVLIARLSHFVDDEILSAVLVAVSRASVSGWPASGKNARKWSISGGRNRSGFGRSLSLLKVVAPPLAGITHDAGARTLLKRTGLYLKSRWVIQIAIYDLDNNSARM